MAYSNYSWGAKPTTPTLAVPLVPGPDPQHGKPTDQEFFNMPPLWMESGSGVPTLPLEYTSNSGVAAIVAPGGPIDRTPRSHSYGVGVGPGLTQAEAAEIRDQWGNQDLGDLAAHQFQSVTDRAGTPGVVILSDTPGHGDSPQTNALKITGVGGTDDPFARTGKRTQRSWTERWDLHRYGVEYRPMRYKGARPAPSQPPVPGGTQYNSPYGNSAGQWANFQPDVFVVPQERRVPEPWDQSLTQQGAVYGTEQITSWGL